jgi:hypothetical protein
MSLLFARDFQKRSAAPPSKNQPESLPVVVWVLTSPSETKRTLAPKICVPFTLAPNGSPAFADATSQHVDALIVSVDALTQKNRSFIAQLALAGNGQK